MNNSQDKTFKDQDLDALLDSYAVPALDKNAFDRGLMTRIRASEKAVPSILWIRYRRIAVLMVVVLVSAALYMRTDPETAQTVSGNDRPVVAMSTQDINMDQDFVNEVVDQEIAMEVYAAVDIENNARSANDSADWDPVMDIFLDDFFGLEYQTL